ncbi:MAG: 4-hydroxythreonine-4-phosphate dehydrogenase PdxA [Nannocystaceae bacterium]
MRRLVLSQGDPDGVGPELLLRLASCGALRSGDLVVAGHANLRRLVERLSSSPAASWATSGWRTIVPLLLPSASQELGQVEALTLAVDHVLASPGWGLVTAPIDKAACMAQGFAHAGHTEYLAQRAGATDVAMVMVGPTLRVALATVHIPLSEVSRRLDVASVVRAGTRLVEALRGIFGVQVPRVGVLGLNPHAGEKGVLGDEEARIVGPAIAALSRKLGPQAQFLGPLPADTAFPHHAAGRYDGLVGMYHDQALGPFKLLHFRDGVNLTMGLPFIRTSPDHGTAKDIAGRGEADPASMLCAIRLARGESKVFG